MIITKKCLPRRTVLRGLGATLGLPLLDGMIPAATALAKTAAKPVRRLGIIYYPNGMSMGYWTPKTAGADFELSQILLPLAPFRDQLLVLSGLTNKPANAIPGEGAGDHSRGPGSFLTGVHIKQTQSDIRSGISMDQIAAKALRRETELASLEMALESVEFVGSCDYNYSCAYSATISWSSPTTPLPMERDPRAVFERLLGDAATLEPQARLADIRQRRSVLDAMTEDAARLQSRISPSDRAKVNQYLEAVRDIEQRLQKTEEQSKELPIVERPSGVPVSFADHFKLMCDLLTLAYEADLTRIFTFMIGKEQSGAAYPECGVTDGHHAVSHHMYVPEKLSKLARINTYHTVMLAYLLQRLRSTQDGDGSLLDHSMICYGAGISDSDAHSHNDLPILLLGGGAGQLKGGRHVTFTKDTPLMNLHLTLLDKMGVPVEQIGDSTGRFKELSDV